MKSGVTALLLACLVPAGATVLQASEAVARTWLRGHPAGAQSEDELAELKTANPDAYAIVKTLLTKRSMGLLDPKHPTASFSKIRTQESAPVEASASVDSESADAMPPQDVSAPAASSGGSQKNWLSWKPQDSAANDEAMVNSVLGAVAQIKGAQPAAAVKEQSIDAMPAATAPEPPVVTVARPATAAPAVKVAPAAAAAVAKVAPSVASSDDVSQPSEQQNSYLAAVDMRPPAKPRKHSQLLDSKNYLTSFSWGDDAPKAVDDDLPKAVAAPPKPVTHTGFSSAAAEKQAEHKGALLAWLGGDADTEVKSKVVVTTQPPQNPYSAFLA